MNTYLLTSNDKSSPGGRRWSIGTNFRQIRKDDRFFMLKMGVDGGIVGFGTITSEPFEDAHWDEGRSAEDAWYVKIKWAVLKSMPHIPIRFLKDQFPSINWSPYSSGSLVDAKVAKWLRERLHSMPTMSLVKPTDNDAVLAKNAALIKPSISLHKPPVGNQVPEQTTHTSKAFKRSPEVVAYVLVRAKGICELCGHRAPFLTDDDEPFLEVHHIKPLEDGGSDTVDNAAGLCPNCHRECHHGKNRTNLQARWPINVPKKKGKTK